MESENWGRCTKRLAFFPLLRETPSLEQRLTSLSPFSIASLAGLARIAFAVRDALSYVEVHLHSPTLSSALSNMGTIGSTSQEMWRKLDENAAIEKRLRNSTRTVYGKRRALWLHCQEMTPNHLATGIRYVAVYGHSPLGRICYN